MEGLSYLFRGKSCCQKLCGLLCCCCGGKDMNVERNLFMDGRRAPYSDSSNAVNNQQNNGSNIVPLVLFNQFKLFFNFFQLAINLSQLVPILKVGN